MFHWLLYTLTRLGLVCIATGVINRKVIKEIYTLYLWDCPNKQEVSLCPYFISRNIPGDNSGTLTCSWTHRRPGIKGIKWRYLSSNSRTKEWWLQEMSWISYRRAELPYSLIPLQIIIFSSRAGPTGLADIGNGGLAQCCRDGWVSVLFMRCSQETAKRKRNWKLSRSRGGSVVPARAIQCCPVSTDEAKLGEAQNVFCIRFRKGMKH